jgi:hypothetical protein
VEAETPSRSPRDSPLGSEPMTASVIRLRWMVPFCSKDVGIWGQGTLEAEGGWRAGPAAGAAAAAVALANCCASLFL